MRQWISAHLTYANVVATLSLFLVLGGGTALASYVISNNSQVGPNTISGHRVFPGNHANLIGGSITAFDVAPNSITGAEIANNSGVDTCTATLLGQYGRICAGSSGQQRNWQNAAFVCADEGLRLPTISEAITLGRTFDVPGVADGTGSQAQRFWTDDVYNPDANNIYRYRASTVNEDGVRYDNNVSDLHVIVVCVADPTN